MKFFGKEIEVGVMSWGRVFAPRYLRPRQLLLAATIKEEKRRVWRWFKLYIAVQDVSKENVDAV